MTLPVYEVEQVDVHEGAGSYSMYSVTCPRRGCRGVFWVPIAWARLRAVEGANGQWTVILGRPCPHCSKTAAIPEAVRIMPSVVGRRMVVLKSKRGKR